MRPRANWESAAQSGGGFTQQGTLPYHQHQQQLQQQQQQQQQQAFHLSQQQWPGQPLASSRPTFVAPLHSFREGVQTVPSSSIQTYVPYQQQQPLLIQQQQQQHLQQQQQQQHLQQQHTMMMQSQRPVGQVQSSIGMTPQLGGAIGYSHNAAQQQYHAIQQPMQQNHQSQVMQRSELIWNSPNRLVQPEQYIQQQQQQQQQHHQQGISLQQHQHQQGIPQLNQQLPHQHQRKPYQEPQQFHPHQLSMQESCENPPGTGKPSRADDDRDRDAREFHASQQEKDKKEREREYQERLNRERLNREREIREREIRDKGQDKGDRHHDRNFNHDRDHQVRNRKHVQRDRDIELPISRDRDIEPPTSRDRDVEHVSSVSTSHSSSVSISFNSHANSHSGKPPMHSLNLLERSFTDLAIRYPHLSIPQTMTHCIANWTRTLPSRGLNSAFVSPLETVSSMLESDVSNKAENVFSHRILHSRVNRVILDNQRQSLRVNDTSSVVEITSPGSLLQSPIDSLVHSRTSEKVPVKFTTRVVLLSTPSRSDESDQAVKYKSFIPNEVCLLLRQQASNYQLLGGSYDSSLDTGNDEESDGPFFDDSCLIKSASRHVLSNSGIDLSECTEWVKLLQIHYHRPETNVISADDESNPQKVSSTPEHIEVVTVFLVLDLWHALRSYKLDNSDVPIWTLAKPIDNDNSPSDVAVEDLTLTSTSVSLMSVRELRSLLSQRGIDSKGRKDELASRLLEAANSEAHKKEEDKSQKTEKYDIASFLVSSDFYPPLEPCLLVIAPFGVTASIQHKLVSLDALLNYTVADCSTEDSVEVILVAESLLELFQRDCAVTIASSLTHKIHKDEQKTPISSLENDEPQKRRRLDGGLETDSSTELKCAFRMFDRKGTGLVALSDIEKAISCAGMRLSRDDIKNVVGQLVVNKGGANNPSTHYTY